MDYILTALIVRLEYSEFSSRPVGQMYQDLYSYLTHSAPLAHREGLMEKMEWQHVIVNILFQARTRLILEFQTLYPVNSSLSFLLQPPWNYHSCSLSRRSQKAGSLPALGYQLKCRVDCKEMF